MTLVVNVLQKWGNLKKGVDKGLKRVYNGRKAIDFRLITDGHACYIKIAHVTLSEAVLFFYVFYYFFNRNYVMKNITLD